MSVVVSQVHVLIRWLDSSSALSGSAHHLFVWGVFMQLVEFFQCEQPSEVIRFSESEERLLSFSPNISAVVVIFELQPLNHCSFI